MTAGLTLDAVTVRARGRTLLDSVSLRVAPGDFVAIVGPNGAGKSTLLRVALGLLRPDAGHVFVDGQDVSGLAPRERAARLAWLPQRLEAAEPITALEQVVSARYRFPESRRASETAAHQALAEAGAQSFALRPITELSGGERQRVAVAGLLAQETPLVLLDEPANFLDPAQQMELYTRMGHLWRAGRGILCVTHDVNVISHAHAPGTRAPRVVGLFQGRVAFERNHDAPDLGEQLGELFGVRMHGTSVEGHRVFVGLPRSGGAS
ncbi:ABC transporter ATP-binding protein [Corallococcus exiguus]|uniref:ABC transporter ATP-binding protein n=1 Tax=Corallococcus TaxID=83461 RepID=UPI000F87E132|nr:MULTISPECIES: ABC transporter ATP-binding protein [Corallococcus]NNC16717.1 ABC transporter ATP-binding protein [Corallococcus exiguus]NRD53956.1 ABC transporter ATP-binding protein [Corallococcus exiguus]RUO91538.1 ABC transporter ATP-binding protein [Corallococcus sp. AB018]